MTASPGLGDLVGGGGGTNLILSRSATQIVSRGDIGWSTKASRIPIMHSFSSTLRPTGTLTIEPFERSVAASLSGGSGENGSIVPMNIMTGMPVTSGLWGSVAACPTFQRSQISE